MPPPRQPASQTVDDPDPEPGGLHPIPELLFMWHAAVNMFRVEGGAPVHMARRVNPHDCRDVAWTAGGSRAGRMAAAFAGADGRGPGGFSPEGPPAGNQTARG